MKVIFGCDPNAAELKKDLMELTKNLGHEVVDMGSTDPIYANTAIAVAEAVASGNGDRGVLVCGTGLGMSIAANKVKGIRCGLCTSVEMARLTKQHNNANILALGGRTTEPELALKIVDEWLDTEFEGGRHQRRVDMLDQM